MEEVVFTPSSLLDLLVNIEELSQYEISMETGEDGITIRIGESAYNIPFDKAQPVEVEEDVVEEVEEANQKGLDTLAEQGLETSETTQEVEGDPIQGGPIKELLKTLMLGGMLRLTTKWLKN